MRKEKHIYIIVDPSMEINELCTKLDLILKTKVFAVQIWDHFEKEENVENIVIKIKSICNKNNVPILINNRWDLANKFDLDGIHFDEIPFNYELIKSLFNNKIKGITLTNNLESIEWLNSNEFHYISFCSIFPSTTSNSCEYVQLDTIKKATKIFKNSIFLAGGINLETIDKLKDLEFDGVAVISGIMNASNPSKTIQLYNDKLN